ncbi:MULTISPECIES: hypothetical protein [Actinoalloteichus]|uniref:Uncharacterized protein n=1 Tax=Actinoalloteichus fjordicus TaxID=1612552 RepID=A0AAC9LIQ4_9PSEU|nr:MULTISPECIES: hypothetical protein [Actinoalloteichus]APU17080.1 hypothetical protein UA74_25355 [Actinoalloteichus fjordicus]APU23161.1 hypothetical protein UA75_25940 [Actinoalloteichus sp. GBA129-24]
MTCAAPRLGWPTWWRACAWLLVAAAGSAAFGWLFDALAVVTGCGDGFGNAGLSGRLDGAACLLIEDGIPLFRLPWADLALGGTLAAAALVATLLTLRAVQRGGGVRAALVPVPALLVAGAVAAVRELQLISVEPVFNPHFRSCAGPARLSAALSSVNITPLCLLPSPCSSATLIPAHDSRRIKNRLLDVHPWFVHPRRTRQ